LIEVDRSMVDISFPDTVVFPNKVDHNFTLIVEVYCSIPVADNSSSSFTSSGKESTPMKVLRKIKREFSLDHLSSPLSTSSSSLSLSPYVPPISTTSSSHHFTLAGHTQFTIKNVMGLLFMLITFVCFDSILLLFMILRYYYDCALYDYSKYYFILSFISHVMNYGYNNYDLPTEIMYCQYCVICISQHILG
jgi:hypothetical protein